MESQVLQAAVEIEQLPGPRGPIRERVPQHERRADSRTAALPSRPSSPRTLRAPISHRGLRSLPPAGEKSKPLVTVILLTYNGVIWIERCLASLRAQTIFDRLEVIVADNGSSDDSVPMASRLAQGWGMIVPHKTNLGYSEGNNRAALKASGKYLFFLNPDTWLEPDCLERLVDEAQRAGATAAGPFPPSR